MGMDAGSVAAAVVGMVAGVGMFGGAAVWLNRYTTRLYGGYVPNVPQAKIHDGRPFRKPRPVGRNRPALYVCRFYVVLLWMIAIGGFIGGLIAIGVEMDDGASYHRYLESRARDQRWREHVQERYEPVDTSVATP